MCSQICCNLRTQVNFLAHLSRSTDAGFHLLQEALLLHVAYSRLAGVSVTELNLPMLWITGEGKLYQSLSIIFLILQRDIFLQLASSIWLHCKHMMLLYIYKHISNLHNFLARLVLVCFFGGIPRWLSDKESAYQCKRCGFSPWVGKKPWWRKWWPTSVFLLEQSHWQRSLAGYTVHGVEKSRTWLKQPSMCAWAGPIL